MINRLSLIVTSSLFFLLCSMTSQAYLLDIPVQPGKIQQSKSTQTPQGLSKPDSATLQKLLARSKYRAVKLDDGSHVSSNIAHGWQIQYAVDGMTTLKPLGHETDTYRIGLKLNAIGYANLDHLESPRQITSDEDTVIYHWDRHVRELWINSEDSVEQWFVLEQPPVSAAAGQLLTLSMTLDTNLDVLQDGDHITFSNKTGTSITYDKLKVWDDNGRELHANMQLGNGSLTLLVDDTRAAYPLTIDPSFRQTTYIKPTLTGTRTRGSRFGISMAISGNTLVVGASWDNDPKIEPSADHAGAVYVFTHDGSVWSQQAYITASNPDAQDYFGSKVAISGDTLVVGVQDESSQSTGVNSGGQSDNSAAKSGAVYVFTRNANLWGQQAYIKASNTEAGDYFGSSVAIAGDTLVVGASGEGSSTDSQNDNAANNSGAAYVFTRNGITWTQQAYIKASNPETYDWFGRSVDVSGDTLVVGAYGEDSSATGVGGADTDDSAEWSGAAYVFVRTVDTWSQQAYVKASNTDAGDYFGSSVAVSGDILAVSATGEASDATGVNGDQYSDPSSFYDAGAVYVFNRSNSTWKQDAYVKASTAGFGDSFGRSLALGADTMVVGTWEEDSSATGVGGDQSDNSATQAGAAYVFTRSNGNWTQQDYVKASNTEAGDNFGSSVAISEDFLAVGAPAEDSSASGINGNETDNSAPDTGAVYVYALAPNIGGTVTGLASGNTLVLQNNMTADLVLSTNGDFAFSGVEYGSKYDITVKTQPTEPNQYCSVTNGEGTVAGDVTDIIINCVTRKYTIGGSVSGLAQGNSLELRNNDSNSLMVSSNGDFEFPQMVDGSTYAVTIATQPASPNQACSIANAVGTIQGANVTNINIDCVTNTYTVTAWASGLATGTSLLLKNNGDDDLTITSDGSYTFATALEDLSTYNVTMQVQLGSIKQKCTLLGGSGTLAGENVSDVSVGCINVHTLSLNVTGPGTVFSSAGGINNCTSACAADYSTGINLELVANLDPPYALGYWQWSDACLGQPSNCKLTMDADKTAGVTFHCQLISIPEPVEPIDDIQPAWECSNLEAVDGFTITLNGDVTLIARESVLLGPEFRVKRGGRLRILVAP